VVTGRPAAAEGNHMPERAIPPPTRTADKSGYRPYRPTQFRSRNHDSAHAEAADDSSPIAVADHPQTPRGKPVLIDQPDALAELLAHLRSAGRFAYDSEFIGELTYVPKLCLIQVATADRVALIDPLVGLDLVPFWELICDPTVEKVVHAGQQDVEPVFRHVGRPAANVFDTQVAAGFVGLAYPVSLSKLVLDRMGAKLGKGLTFTNWDQRPLSPMQMRYAADDVRYLLAVRDELGRQLDALGHTAWAAAETAAVCDPASFAFDPDTAYLKVRGAGGLPPRNGAVLRELAIWRDAQAREHDVPARTFLKDEVLLDLARQPAKTLDRIAKVRGLPRPVEQAYGAEILAVTARGLATPVDRLPPVRDDEPTPRQRFNADAAWSLLGVLCAGRSIDPSLISSRQDVGEVYRALAAGNPPPSDARLLKGWRREAIGQAMLDLLAGRGSLDVRWADDGLRSSLDANLVGDEKRPS
jgi:ribonuclease D